MSCVPPFFSTQRHVLRTRMFTHNITINLIHIKVRSEHEGLCRVGPERRMVLLKIQSNSGLYSVVRSSIRGPRLYDSVIDECGRSYGGSHSSTRLPRFLLFLFLFFFFFASPLDVMIPYRTVPYIRPHMRITVSDRRTCPNALLRSCKSAESTISFCTRSASAPLPQNSTDTASAFHSLPSFHR